MNIFHSINDKIKSEKCKVPVAACLERKIQQPLKVDKSWHFSHPAEDIPTF
jgi:hypothetical protein